MAFPTPGQLKQLLTELVDAEYTRATAAVVTAMTQPVQDGRLAQRLKDLDAAAAAGPIRPNGPEMVALLADLERVLKTNAALVDGVSPSLQRAMAGAAADLTKRTMFVQDAAIVAKLATPDPEAVAALIGYVDSAAWSESLAKYQTDTLQTINNIAIRGLVTGRNPRATAAELAASVRNLPISRAEQMMRSLQLTSLRDAAVVHQVANADVIARIVRVAALDDRTCLACVALHGTVLAVGERVNDHRKGRCIGIAVPASKANDPISQTYVVDGQPVQVASGEQWMQAHSAAWQRAFMGPGAYNAYTAGAVQMRDFVHPYQDDVFGPALQEASLKGILGDKAKDYYQR